MSKVALVVDDSMVIRKMVTMALKAISFEVLDAPDGRRALEVAKGKDLALVITDLNMPVMTGLEFIHEFRADPDHKFTPILFLTTETDEAMRNEARSAGATAWIVKPFHPDKLIAVIQKLGI